MIDRHHQRDSILSKKALISCFLFIFLTFIYNINLDFLPVNDAMSGTYLSMSLINEGNLSFTPEEFPFMFMWGLKTDKGIIRGSVRRMNEKISGKSAQELYNKGLLFPLKEKYYLMPSVHEGLYVNTFGIGAGLAVFPFPGFIASYSR